VHHCIRHGCVKAELRTFASHGFDSGYLPALAILCHWEDNSRLWERSALCSPGLLQLTFLWHIWWTDDPAAVYPECCCTSCVWRSMVRPHHAGATPAALASGLKVGGLQDGYLGLPFIVRNGSGLPGSSHMKKVVVSCILPSPGLQADLQQLWGLMFCGCRPWAVEPSSSWS